MSQKYINLCYTIDAHIYSQHVAISRLVTINIDDSELTLYYYVMKHKTLQTQSE